MTLQTSRLSIREFSLDNADAAFVLQLLNEPGFIANIRDSGVRTEEDARAYIATGPLASYARHGFGLMRVALRDTDEPIGMCGLLQRDTLPAPDVGFAFLERHWGQGYAQEAAEAIIGHGRERLGMTCILGVTAPHNLASGRVLEKVGLRFVDVREVGGKESRFYEWP